MSETWFLVEKRAFLEYAANTAPVDQNRGSGGLKSLFLAFFEVQSALEGTWRALDSSWTGLQELATNLYDSVHIYNIYIYIYTYVAIYYFLLYY